MVLVPFKARGPESGPVGGLWGHFPELRLVLDAKAEPVEADSQARAVKALELELRALKAVEDALGEGVNGLEATALWSASGGWSVAVRPSEGVLRWVGRASVIRYSRVLRRLGAGPYWAMR